MFDKVMVGSIATVTAAVVLLVLAAAYDVAFRKKQDTAEDVMKSCVDTGMYLHKGYAITCRVLVDGSFDPQRGTEAV